MARINLLPWRDEYRQEKQKEFVTVLVGVALLVLVAVYLWTNAISSAIDSQKERNQLLNEEITVLNKEVKEIQKLKKRRAELLSRMKVIQGLQGERPVIVRYFDDLVRAVPEGVYLTELKRTGQKIQLTGITESNVRVSAFMRNLDASEWFFSPNLKSVTAAPKYGEQASEFTMSLATTKPNGEGQVAAKKQFKK